MTRSQAALVSIGLILVSISMLYGFYYAVFDEHQTLEKIGVSMATGFVNAAESDMDSARMSLKTYADTRVEYLREVHGHGHLAALGTLLVVMGIVFKSLLHRSTTQTVLAFLLIVGAICLPFGAWFDAINLGALSRVLSITGAVSLIIGMAGVTLSLIFDSSK